MPQSTGWKPTPLKWRLSGRPYVIIAGMRHTHRPNTAFYTAIFASILAATDATPVEWIFPRTGTCHEGMAFSDGKTGVLLWGGGETVNLTVGRADLWDHRGGYPWTEEQSYTNIVDAVQKGDVARLSALFRKETPPGEPRNPYMLPLGRAVITISGAELKRGELDPYTGTARVWYAKDGGEQAFDVAMCKEYGGAFAIRFPRSADVSAKSIPATDTGVYEKSLKPLGFMKAVKRDDGARGGFDWKLPADPSVSLDWSLADGVFTLTTRRGAPGCACGGGAVAYEDIEAATKARWSKFWSEGAKVRVPDPVLQRVFEYGMYRFGAMTDPDGVPAGLQGPWLEDDRLVPWNGDYHFNINIQECYSPAYRGGHFAHLLPMFRMVLSWRDRLADNARKFAGIDGGYVLPHSVDDRGVCIGGFWTGTIDHGSTAWAADMMWRYVKYSGDAAFLRDGAYDFMKGAMKTYLAMMEERDGRLSIPVGPSPEWAGNGLKGAVGRDPSFQLAAAHALARDLIAAAALLGEKPDPAWLDVQKRLPRYNADETGFLLFDGQRFTDCHRHHSHMAGFFPFDTIDMSDPAAKAAADATYATWVSRGTRKWTGWCVPWASVLNTHFGKADEAADLVRKWDRHFCDDGHGSHHNGVRAGFTDWNGGLGVMQMDGQCAATTAILEMLAHETNGKTEFFKGCPAEWEDVSFENLALSDGRRVDGRRLHGKITITRR